jgi:hypothetical protein
MGGSERGCSSAAWCLFIYHLKKQKADTNDIIIINGMVIIHHGKGTTSSIIYASAVTSIFG